MCNILIGIDDAYIPTTGQSVSYVHLVDILNALRDEIKQADSVTPVFGVVEISRALDAGAKAVERVVRNDVLVPPARDSVPARREVVEDEWIFPGSTTAPSFCVG